jgi:glycosyltransferase involved in cell wall biosynthesis
MAAASNSIKPGSHVLLLASYADSLINFRGPLIRDILAAGYRLTVAAPTITADLKARLEAMGAAVADAPLARTGTNPLTDLRYLKVLKALFRRTRPDLAITYTIKPNIWGALAGASLGVPTAAMVTGLGYAFTGNATIKQRLVRALATLLYRAATNKNRVVVFQNPDDLKDFVEAGCLADPSKARMVNGSGVDCFHYARKPLPDEPVFLMISRLLGNKGVREYAAAALTVKVTHPAARFLLVGYLDEGPDGIAQSELRAWIAGGVEYLGPQGDVRPSIASASIYVLPSYREGTPRSVLEAMAMGRPILTTDAPGCRETTQDGVNGYRVPIKDVGELAERMRELISQPELRARMGEASHRIALERYEVSAVNRTLMKHLGLARSS